MKDEGLVIEFLMKRPFCPYLNRSRREHMHLLSN